MVDHINCFLVQKLLCKTCGEPREAHIYYYAHHNKQLTIQVRHFPADWCLPGEREGKLWMWSRCGKCKLKNGNSKSTKRILISAAARGLSFGKFLELSFSNSSFFSAPSGCGHSFHRDFVFFFGYEWLHYVHFKIACLLVMQFLLCIAISIRALLLFSIPYD